MIAHPVRTLAQGAPQRIPPPPPERDLFPDSGIDEPFVPDVQEEKPLPPPEELLGPDFDSSDSESPGLSSRLVLLLISAKSWSTRL